MTNLLNTPSDPNLPDDLTREQVTELCDLLREKAITMNPNVDITRIEIGFGMHTEMKNGKPKFRTYGVTDDKRYYFSRNPIHQFITTENT